MPPKRPRDPNQLGKAIIDIATGQKPDRDPTPEELWEMNDLVVMLEQWEWANRQPEYNFVVRKYDIGKGYSVSVLWRGGEIDTIYGFETEHAALEWVRERSQPWLDEQMITSAKGVRPFLYLREGPEKSHLRSEDYEKLHVPLRHDHLQETNT
jgi:hypothetical protein